MIPGQTNMVTCDITGRIVDFEIQKGKGNLNPSSPKINAEDWCIGL